MNDGLTSNRSDHELPASASEAAERQSARQRHAYARQRRARRWSRNGTASAFGTRPEDGCSGVGWVWEITREGPEQRLVRVEVCPGPYRVTDLPAEARNAIRSRGATAVDAFLATDDPPARILVSTQGLQPHYTIIPPAIAPSAAPNVGG